MKRILNFIPCVCALAFFVATAHAQFGGSSRLEDYSRRLVDQANDVAARSYNDYRSRGANSRSDTESLLLAAQFSAAANTFRQMVQDRRPASELRDAAGLLDSLARTADRNFSTRSYFRDAQRTVSDITREIGGFGSGGDYNPFPQNDNRITGRMRWSGRVDDEVQIQIRGNDALTRTISGTEYNFGTTYNFTSPLPRRPVNVTVNKIKGRGEVRVLQQPSRTNDFTAVVQIRDPKGGAADYEFELTW